MTDDEKRVLMLDYAKRFGCVHFVETGTGDGRNLHDMLLSHQFKQAHTIDIMPEVARKAYSRYHHLPHVHFWTGDSAQRLAPVIKRLQGPILFWLAAHHGDPRKNGKGPGQSPILAELEAISKHVHAKDHVVLIDGAGIYERTNRKYREYVKLDAIKRAADGLWTNGTARNWEVSDDIVRLTPEEKL